VKTRKTFSDYGREWLDTLVVAISVAMAFRAYFYEPFNIPTGSMRPTLYGNHVQECREPGVWQKTPLKWLNWIASGRDYKDLVAPCAGTVRLHNRHDGRFGISVASPSGGAGRQMTLPTEAAAEVSASLGLTRECWENMGRYSAVDTGVHVAKGQRIWAGYDTTGDFIFVNRWAWNFHKPARGDVMIFSTTGIAALPQGTHYIKRMTALPNETIEIRNPDVYIDGKAIPLLKPAIGANGEKSPPPDAGPMRGPAKLGPDEYFACGDNSYPMNMSADSRYWGPVPGDKLRGVASCVFWPIVNPRWGRIK